MNEETHVSSAYVYNGKTFNIRKDIVKTHDNREAQRDIVEHDECVAIIAVDEDGKVLLVDQFRYTVGKSLLEIPAGGIDGDETPEEAVIREMQEETGYRPEKVEILGGFYSAPGFCTEYLHLCLATGLTPGQLYAEDTDSITLVRIDAEEISGLIQSGKICDAKSIAGLYQWLDYRKSN